MEKLPDNQVIIKNIFSGQQEPVEKNNKVF